MPHDIIPFIERSSRATDHVRAIAMRQDGMSCRAIARELGRREKIVARWLRKAGFERLPHPRSMWPDERLHALAALLAAGNSPREAADKLGVTRNAVIGAADRNGFKILTTAARSDNPRKRRRKPSPLLPPHRFVMAENEPSGCRYAIGPFGEAGWRWCGRPLPLNDLGVPTSSFCRAHHEQCWVRAT